MRRVEKFKWAETYIIDELKSGRHIAACLGSAGFTFRYDIKNFKEYLSKIRNQKLIDIIDNNRELTMEELESLKGGKN